MKNLLAQLSTLKTSQYVNLCMWLLLFYLPIRMSWICGKYVCNPGKWSSAFYVIHMGLLATISLLCIITMIVNQTRGRKCWYFTVIILFDIVMLAPAFLTGNSADSTAGSLLYLLYYEFLVLLLEALETMRRIRLKIYHPRWWNIALKVLWIHYTFQTVEMAVILMGQ
ncbi:MAG: hypothetical protein IJ169_08240 [Paludibacteraceae bacterium]|nr:hypothetical protein [Paludibacteraceae bacterium]